MKKTYDNITTFTVCCNGDLNAMHVHGIKKRILYQLEKGYQLFVINLKKTRHIDLGGISLLVELTQYVRKNNGDIKLSNIDDATYKTLRLIGLIESFSSKEQAVQELVAC